MAFPNTGYDPRYAQDIWGRQGVDDYGRLQAYQTPGLPGGEPVVPPVPPLGAQTAAPAGQFIPPSIMGDGGGDGVPYSRPFDWDAQFNPMRDVAGMKAPEFSWGGALKESLGFGDGSAAPGGGLMGALGGDDPYARAQTADLAQKTLGMGGMFGASVLAPFGAVAGEYARQVANEAYAPYGEIGFVEDIMQPDIFYGSPEDILSGLRGAQDKVIGGVPLNKEDKQGIADYLNAKGGDVTAEDITDQGAVSGSPQDLALQEQMAGFGPEYGVTPDVTQYPSAQAANMAVQGLLAQPPAQALGGQQVSQADREASAQQAIAAEQARVARATAERDARALAQADAAAGGQGRSYSAADARERESRRSSPSSKYGGREYGR